MPTTAQVNACYDVVQRKLKEQDELIADLMKAYEKLRVENKRLSEENSCLLRERSSGRSSRGGAQYYPPLNQGSYQPRQQMDPPKPVEPPPPVSVNIMVHYYDGDNNEHVRTSFISHLESLALSRNVKLGVSDHHDAQTQSLNVQQGLLLYTIGFSRVDVTKLKTHLRELKRRVDKVTCVFLHTSNRVGANMECEEYVLSAIEDLYDNVVNLSHLHGSYDTETSVPCVQRVVELICGSPSASVPR